MECFFTRFFCHLQVIVPVSPIVSTEFVRRGASSLLVHCWRFLAFLHLPDTLIKLLKFAPACLVDMYHGRHGASGKLCESSSLQTTRPQCSLD